MNLGLSTVDDWMGKGGQSFPDEYTISSLLDNASILLPRLKEEVDEIQTKAIDRRDVVELLDAVLDTKWYLCQYVNLLIKAGIAVQGAWEAIVVNNNSKYTTSVQLAQKWYLAAKAAGREYTLSDTVFDGETYFCLKDATGKVRKWEGFEEVDLREFVPQDLQLFWQLHDTLPNGEVLNDIKAKYEYNELVATGLGEVIYKDFPKSYEELVQRQEV